MTDKPDSQAAKPGRPYVLLPPTLAQLVEDRFDEDQHEQAVALLEQLLTYGSRPSPKSVQKLLALSLCSLSPGQLASTSRWTLDDQLHNIAAGLMVQSKNSNRDNNAIKAAAASQSERPSSTTVIKATALLFEYAQAVSQHRATKLSSAAEPSDDRVASLHARQVLESLPSRRKPLSTPPSTSPGSSRRTRRTSDLSDVSDGGEPFEASSIERWVFEHLHRADDVWDLLCGRQYSAPPPSGGHAQAHVTEFWMSIPQRKRYLKQLQSTNSSSHRLEDRLRELQRRKRSGETIDSSSSSESEQESDNEDDWPRLSTPGRSNKRVISSNGRRRGGTASSSPKKRSRSENVAVSQRDDEAAERRHLQLTEGAWRTLSVLVALWEQTAPPDTSDGVHQQDAPLKSDTPPLLWQFPRTRLVLKVGRAGLRGADSNDATDDVDRALDVAFSFSRILPAFTPQSVESGADVSLLNKANSSRDGGRARLLSSVPQAELKHRQTIGEQKLEQTMAERAETAARLLASIYQLVKLEYIQDGAFVEGMSDRLESLSAREIQYLSIPLLHRQPSAVARVLATYLEDITKDQGGPKKPTSASALSVRFADDVSLSLDLALAQAQPSEEAADAILRTSSRQDENGDAKAVLDFLSLHDLKLDGSADEGGPIAFPDQTSGKSVVRKHVSKVARPGAGARIKGRTTHATTDEAGAKVDTALTDDVKKGGLVALAVVRILQMQGRDRLNQVKLLLARSLSCASEQDAGTQRRDVRTFMSRLIKAFERDADEMEACLAAMASHVDKADARRVKSESRDNGASGALALPSMHALVERGDAFLDATRTLAHSTRVLRECLAQD